MAEERLPPQASGDDVPADLKLWRGRLELAKWFQANHGNTDNRWTKFVKALASDFGPSGHGEAEDTIDVNMVHGTTVINLSPLYTTEIHIAIRPTQAKITIDGKEVDNTRRAQFTELELNYWWKELEVRTRVLKPCAYDAETTNHMYAYVGWNKATGKLSDGDGKLEYNPLVQKDRPYIIRLSPRQVLVPPGFPAFDEAPWIAIGWRKDVEVCKGMWPDTTDGLEPTIDLFNTDDIRKTHQSPILDNYLRTEDAKFVQLWQIWDRMKQKLITIAENHDTIIEEGDWPHKLEGFPVAHERFVEIPDEFYGTPPIQMYWPQQQELNSARSASKRRNNRSKNVIFMKAEMAEELAEKYANAQDGEILPVPLLEEDDMRKHMMIDPGLAFPNHAYADGQVQIGDIAFTSGIGAQQRGQADPGLTTATASANVDKWALVRAVDRGDRMKTFILCMAKKLWMILQQHENVKVERMVKGNLGWAATNLKYSLEELKGEYGFDLDIGALMADNPARREQLAFANYNLLRADPELEPKKLITDIIDSQGKSDPMAYMADLKDPQEEMALMARGLPVEPNRRDDHLLHHKEHTNQANQISASLDQMDQADSTEGRKLRLMLTLTVAHLQAHAIWIKQITGESPAQPGQPVSENSLRGQLNAVGGGSGVETDAEIGGQSLSGGIAPAGQGGIAGNIARGG